MTARPMANTYGSGAERGGVTRRDHHVRMVLGEVHVERAAFASSKLLDATRRGAELASELASAKAQAKAATLAHEALASEKEERRRVEAFKYGTGDLEAIDVGAAAKNPEQAKALPATMQLRALLR